MLDFRTHRPALVIVDMQNGFCHSGGTFGQMGIPTTDMMGVVPAIDHLRQAFRAKKLPIFFTRLGWNADYNDAGLLLDALPVVKELQGFVRGSWDAEILDELTPDIREGEVVVDKTRNTVFYDTGFEKVLQKQGVEFLVVVGVGTNVCVESTVRDAFTRGLRVVTVGNATATTSREEHEASLKSLVWFGGVVTGREVEEALEGVEMES